MMQSKLGTAGETVRYAHNYSACHQYFSHVRVAAVASAEDKQLHIKYDVYIYVYVCMYAQLCICMRVLVYLCGAKHTVNVIYSAYLELPLAHMLLIYLSVFVW